jgi:hypothetical protein
MVANRINSKLSNLTKSSGITFLIEMKPLSRSGGEAVSAGQRRHTQSITPV